MRVKSELKSILDERGISIRQAARECELPVETVRRLYNDDTKQFQRDTIGAICKRYNLQIGDLLTLTEDE